MHEILYHADKTEIIDTVFMFSSFSDSVFKLCFEFIRSVVREV